MSNERKQSLLLGDAEPDFINEEGVKWWFDKSITDYSQIPGIEVWLVEETNGHRTRLVIYNKEIIYDSQSVEAIGVQLDLYKTYPDLLQNG